MFLYYNDRYTIRRPGVDKLDDLRWFVEDYEAETEEFDNFTGGDVRYNQDYRIPDSISMSITFMKQLVESMPKLRDKKLQLSYQVLMYDRIKNYVVNFTQRFDAMSGVWSKKSSTVPHSVYIDFVTDIIYVISDLDVIISGYEFRSNPQMGEVEQDVFRD